MADKKAFTTLLSARAQKEIVHAWNWYEERQQGLGNRFVSEVTKKITRIESAPEVSPLKFKSFREAAVPIFPYILIYRVDKRKRVVYILAAFHLL